MDLAAINQILLVAAHPDDEVLSCGGTFVRTAYVGVQVLIVAEGSTSHQQNRDSFQVEVESSFLTLGCGT